MIHSIYTSVTERSMLAFLPGSADQYPNTEHSLTAQGCATTRGKVLLGAAGQGWPLLMVLDAKLLC